MTVGDETVPGWVTVSAYRTKRRGQACFMSALTHMQSGALRQNTSYSYLHFSATTAQQIQKWFHALTLGSKTSSRSKFFSDC